MRFLILIFVLFLGCEDDPVSPPDTDDGSINNNNEIVGQWTFEFTQVYNNADCQSDYSHNIDGQAQIMPNVETYTKIDKRYLSNGVSLDITFICDDENLSINCTYSVGINSSYNIVEESNGFTNLTLVESDITQVQGPIDFYTENDEQYMMIYGIWDNNEGCGVVHFKKVPEIEIEFPEFVEGCTIYPGEYYNEDANVLCFDCCGNIYGCTDSNACNSFSFATVDDGSCWYPSEECGDCDNSPEVLSCIDICGIVDGNNSSDCGSCTEYVNIAEQCFDIEDQSITELYLSESNITLIPPNLYYLCYVEQIFLDSNNISSINFPSYNFNNSFSECTPNIIELYLSNNQLETVPTLLAYYIDNLEIFDVEDNQLTSLPNNICDLSETIYLHGNKLCEEYRADCFNDSEWGTQDQSNCCEGPEGQPNWTTCPE